MQGLGWLSSVGFGGTVDVSYTPKGRVWFEVKLEGAVEVGGVEMGMEDIMSMII